MTVHRILGVLGLASCAVATGCNATDLAGTGLAPELLSFTAATQAQCPGGGTQVQNYLDTNGNGRLDPGEQVLSSSTLCNGTNGGQGNGAGIQVTTAPQATCPAGGDVLTTFIDANNNGALEPSEQVTSVSAVCNGIAGRDGGNGSSVHLTVTAATAWQCPAGGAVYSTYEDGQTPVLTMVCNGQNGQNGQNGANAMFEMGAVGPAVSGEAYSACHHDYIYIPGTASARGWLIFRHQFNGAADQGIGSTGFEVWDVDIADFELVSETGGVAYCQLHWDPGTRALSFTVLDGSDGLAGTTGTIQL